MKVMSKVVPVICLPLSQRRVSKSGDAPPLAGSDWLAGWAGAAAAALPFPLLCPWQPGLNRSATLAYIPASPVWPAAPILCLNRHRSCGMQLCIHSLGSDFMYHLENYTGLYGSSGTLAMLPRSRSASPHPGRPLARRPTWTRSPGQNHQTSRLPGRTSRWDRLRKGQ